MCSCVLVHFVFYRLLDIHWIRTVIFMLISMLQGPKATGLITFSKNLKSYIIFKLWSPSVVIAFFKTSPKSGSSTNHDPGSNKELLTPVSQILERLDAYHFMCISKIKFKFQFCNHLYENISNLIWNFAVNFFSELSDWYIPQRRQSFSFC